MTGSAGADGPTGPTGPTGVDGLTGAPGGGPTAQWAFLSAGQVFNNATTATFNQMTIPIASGNVYSIHGVFPFNLLANTNGIRLGLLFPAARRANFSVVGPLAGASVIGIGTISLQTNSVLVTSGTAGENRTLTVDGTLICSGSGYLVPFGANEQASGSNDFLQGSHIIVWNLGPQAV